MAGRGRTRASAQPEPAAAMPPPAARTTRSTRAQSKEVESSGVPVATMQDAEADLKVESSAGVLDQGLYTQLEEDEEDDDEDEHFEDAVEASQEPDAATQESQPSGLGQELVPSTQYQQSEASQGYQPPSTLMRADLSGTPAGSQAIARILKTFLPKLFDAADVVANHLYTQDVYEAWGFEFDTYEEEFVHIRNRHFKSDSSFIDRDQVLQKVGEVHANTAAAYDATEVVAAANIATLLCDAYHLLSENPSDQYIVEQLQRWDDAFPTSFLPSSMPNGNQWDDIERDFSIVLDLRTLVMVYAVQASLDTDDTNLMSTASVWFNGIDVKDPRLLLVLNGKDDGTMSFRDIAGLSLNDAQNVNYRKHCVERLRNIIKEMTNEDNDVATNMGRLKEMFSLEKLMGSKGSLTDWCHSMFAHIKNSRRARSSNLISGPGTYIGGSVAASQILGQDDSQVDPSMSVYSQPPSQDPANDHAQNLQNVQMLYGQMAPPPPAQQQRYLPQSQSSSAYSQNGSSYPTQPLAGPAEFSLGMGPLRSPAPSQSAGALYATSAASGAVQLGKRPRTATQDDDDDEFAMGEAQNVAPKPRKKRQRINKPNPDLVPDNQVQNSRGADVDLVRLSQEARRETQIARKPREPQSRTPWSRGDTKKLIIAVDRYKCKWSMIEAAIVNGTLKFDTPRNQQALRDKARLLKQDMLKTDIVLPASFDYVVLGKKERQAVIACGRNPDRKEADVDEEGKPSNTIYGGNNNPADVAPGENEAQRDHGQEVAQGDATLGED